MVLSSQTTSSSVETPQQCAWSDLALDHRLCQAINEQEFSLPTLIQSRAIPLLLQGKSVIACSRTGSGKTIAYAIPLLQLILHRASTPKSTRMPVESYKTSALILVPTRELASQITRVFQALAWHCRQIIRIDNISLKPSSSTLHTCIGCPDIVVATPGRAAAALQNKTLDLTSLSHLVIDEADLILSYGYQDDLNVLACAVPDNVQICLMSATLRPEDEVLRQVFFNQQNPVFLDLLPVESAQQSCPITQYIVKCGEDEKFLLIYIIFKLKLMTGKIIVFVGDIDRCYRVKLFLEQFGIKSCILNSELPVNSRIHVVEEFNCNVYDIIIASDENEVMGRESNSQQTHCAPRNNREYGVSRGIDFKCVAGVINFDLPRSAKSYIHRIGRTGRAGQTGTVMSFVIPRSEFKKHKGISFEACKDDEQVFQHIVKSQDDMGNTIQPYQFDMSTLQGFKYRLRDALKSVTSIVIREARIREIKMEIAKSDKLKEHFEKNPNDLLQLRHDTNLLPSARILSHLRHIPDYLLPKGMARSTDAVPQGGIGFMKTLESSKKPRKSLRHPRKNPRFIHRSQRKSKNPLQNL